jgi:sugar phosphate isomerase/epimerase
MPMNRRLFLAGLTALGACATMSNKPLAGKPIGIQLYALGPRAYNDLDATFGALAEIGYREVEIGENNKPAADVRAALARSGLTCVSIHTAGAAQAPANVADAAARSAEYAHGVGASYAGPSIFPFVRERPAGVTNPAEMIGALARSYTRDDWLRVCDILNTTAGVFQRSGLKYAYHNHNVEFAPFAGGTMMDFILANTDPNLVKLQVDVGWVKAAGVDPAAFIRQHAARVRMLHVKDLKASTQPNFALRMDPTEVGSGVQDWQAILSAGRDAGVEHFLVEQEPPFERPEMDAARISYNYLRTLA